MKKNVQLDVLRFYNYEKIITAEEIKIKTNSIFEIENESIAVDNDISQTKNILKPMFGHDRKRRRKLLAKHAVEDINRCHVEWKTNTQAVKTTFEERPLRFD